MIEIVHALAEPAPRAALQHDQPVSKLAPTVDYWGLDWLWGLPLLVTTVVIHICAFVLMEQALVMLFRGTSRPRSMLFRVSSISVLALAAALLHAVEAIIWALLYLLLGALPSLPAAILYSLSAITAYGHAALYLEPRWQLLGAIEAVNGLILFGLTTAFLFAAIAVARRPRREQ